MQKTYWWRILILFLGSIVFGFGYLVTSIASLDNWYTSYTDASMFLSLALLVVSPALFFVDDVIFKKWFRFGLVWFFVSIILIASTPVSYNSFMSFSPDRETVSIWLSELFVIVSLALIIRMKWKLQK